MKRPKKKSREVIESHEMAHGKVIEASKLRIRCACGKKFKTWVMHEEHLKLLYPIQPFYIAPLKSGKKGLEVWKEWAKEVRVYWKMRAKIVRKHCPIPYVRKGGSSNAASI